MSTENTTLSAVSLPSAPYVGNRPFEETDKAIFKGRDRDAVLLRDKVFSALLTILYGPSGIGKSSILRALLAPELEDEEARVIYFDDWRGDDPMATLKTRLIEEATKLNIPDAAAGAPSLTELVRLLNSAEDKTLVLILDQFEELFTAQGRQVDPLRKELGALMRSPNLDVRVLLSLREEHLASLEPFRAEILNLFQSTYRLEPLANVAEAIEGPVKLFGADYEPGLVKELVADLRQEADGAKAKPQAAAAEAPADLPLLQQVCLDLWNEAKRQGQKTITSELYRTLGGRQGILDAYLRRVMPGHWSGQVLTAQLMRYLAPPDGHKVSYSANHLAGLAGFSIDRVRSELERLSVSESEVRVLRSRQYGAGNFLYELRHDSFIRIIAPWRDDILRREEDFKRARKNRQRYAAVFLIMASIVAIIWLKDGHELKKNTERVWVDDRPSVQKFDHVANYLLWTRSGEKRLDRLKKELDDHRFDLPPDYGVDRSGVELIVLPREMDWPLTLHYSSARRQGDQYFEYLFTKTWQDHARYINKTWGIPVPLKLRLAHEDTYPKESVKLTGNQIEPLELNLPSREEDAYFSSENISEPGMEFLERFKDAWTPVNELEHGGPLWIVPRWSLPAWKASGILATDGSGLPAWLLATELLNKPDRLLTREAVEVLLDKVTGRYPVTVAEARAVRGDRLTTDLQEIVKQQQRALTGLPTLLDVLANYPEGSSSEIAEKISVDIDSAQAALPLRLRGPKQIGSQSAMSGTRPGAASRAIHKAYQEAAEWIPPVEPEIRLYLGKNLDSMWITMQNEFQPEYIAQTGRILDSIVRQFGIQMPYPEVRRAGWDQALPPDAFRIEVLNQDKQHSDAAPVVVRSDEALARLSSSLLFRAESYRIHFLNAENIDAELKTMDPSLRSWLTGRYSLTDLKLLLRGVINPSAEELGERQKALDAGEVDRKFEIPPEQSIRNPSWLLASLVFWSKVDDARSLPDMAKALRATQHARFHKQPLALRDIEINKFIEEGVRALGAGHTEAAEAAFSRAVQSDRRASVSVFLSLYPIELRRSLIKNLTASCKDVGQTHVIIPNRGVRADLEDIIAEKDFDKDVGMATARRLRLCLLASYPEGYRKERRALGEEIAKRYDTPGRWPPHEAALFGKELHASFDHRSDDISVAKKAFAFLQSSLPQLTKEERYKLVSDVLKICRTPGPNKWCWDLLPDLAQGGQDPVTTLDVALALAEREVRTDAERALTLVDQAKVQLRNAKLQKENHNWHSDWGNFIRAQALIQLSRFGAGDGLKEAESLLQGLLDSPAVGSRSYQELARLRTREGRVEDAIKIIDHALKKWPGEGDIYGIGLAAWLAAGNSEKVAQAALTAREKIKRNPEGKVTEETDGFAFVAALGLLMTQTDTWELASREFLATNNHNVSYIAMLLSSRMTGKGRNEAREVIERHWARARPDTWKVRLREGDVTAWREKLIGYYVEKVGRKQIFDDLEDEARFANSELRNVPMSRASMLCEAYFYDALLAEANGDRDRMKASLEKVLSTDAPDYFEYSMAKFMLAQTH